MKSAAYETLSRWLWPGVPLLIGVGVLGAVVLHLSFSLPFARVAIPIAVLLSIQLAFYVVMFAARRQYGRTRDLRAGFVLTAIYGLFIVLAGMYYAGQLGIVGVKTFEDNYVGFSAFMAVVICVGVGFLSFLKPKLTP
jgi:hypothetical protein